jgi:hypothetical protein
MEARLASGEEGVINAEIETGDAGYWLDTVGRFCPWGAVVVSRGG